MGGLPHDDRKSDDSIRGKNLQSSGGLGGGGGRPPPMMIENVMMQFGVHFNRKGGGGGQEELEAKAKNQLGKQRMQKAKARKPPRATNQTERNCECKGCHII